MRATSIDAQAPEQRCAPSTPRAVPSDGDLVSAAARGDSDALGELHDRYRPQMLSLARRILRDDDDAEDLLHDVLLEAWRHAATYDATRGSVPAWLLMRLRSRALDRLRSARSSKVTSIEVVGVRALRIVVQEVEHAVAPDSAIVRRRISSLRADQRAVLDLAYFRGLSLSEVATELDVPLGTIKSRLGRALRSLRRDLGAEAFAGD